MMEHTDGEIIITLSSFLYAFCVIFSSVLAGFSFGIVIVAQMAYSNTPLITTPEPVAELVKKVDYSKRYLEQYAKEFNALEARVLSASELSALKFKNVKEEVVVDDDEEVKKAIIMTYNSETESFWYYTDSVTKISYTMLDMVARAFAIAYNCKTIYIGLPLSFPEDDMPDNDMQEEYSDSSDEDCADEEEDCADEEEDCADEEDFAEEENSADEDDSAEAADSVIIPEDAVVPQIADAIVSPTVDVVPPTVDVVPPTVDVVPPTEDVVPPTEDVVPPTKSIFARFKTYNDTEKVLVTKNNAANNDSTPPADAYKIANAYKNNEMMKNQFKYKGKIANYVPMDTTVPMTIDETTIKNNLETTKIDYTSFKKQYILNKI
jgi:hypothetical protein